MAAVTAAAIGAAGSAIGGALGGANKSGGDPIRTSNDIINVSPTALNLGEILRNFEGPRENGGLGLQRKSLFNGNTGAFNLSGSGGFTTIALVGLAGIALLMLLKMRK